MRIRWVQSVIRPSNNPSLIYIYSPYIIKLWFHIRILFKNKITYTCVYFQVFFLLLSYVDFHHSAQHTLWYDRTFYCLVLLHIPSIRILTSSTSLGTLFINIIVSNTIYYIIEYCDYYNLTNCKDVPEIITILHNLLIKKWLSIFVLLILE